MKCMRLQASRKTAAIRKTNSKVNHLVASKKLNSTIKSWFLCKVLGLQHNSAEIMKWYNNTNYIKRGRGNSHAIGWLAARRRRPRRRSTTKGSRRRGCEWVRAAGGVDGEGREGRWKVRGLWQVLGALTDRAMQRVLKSYSEVKWWCG